MIEITKEILMFAEDVSFFLKCEVYLVGSSLKEESPRDLDIRAIMSREQFEKEFCSIQRFKRETKSINWTEEGRLKWNKVCIQISLLPSAKQIENLDFQICWEGQYNKSKFLLSK